MTTYATVESCLLDYLLKMDTVQRLKGLVSELSFEKYFAPRLFTDEISLGWLSNFHDPSSKNRNWYKVASAGYSLSPAEKTLVGKLSPIGHRFFIVVPTINLGDPPTIKLKLIRCLHGCHGVWMKEKRDGEASDQRKLIENRVASKLAELQKKTSKTEGRDWFLTLDLQELKRVFVTRSLVNYGINYPTDVDGILYSPEKDKLAFVEFKRKYIAKGYFTLLEDHDVQSYKAKATEYGKILLNSIREAPEDEIAALRRKQEQEIYSKLYDKSVWRETQTECFGLDFSHVKNVQLCEKFAFDYTYVIWDHVPGELDTMFDKQFKPKETLTVISKNVTVKDLEGMSFTIGKKSGSFTDDPRFQLMIPRIQFTDRSSDFVS